MSTREIFTDKSLSISLNKYPPGFAMPFHHHDFLSISLLMKGDLVEDSENGKIIPSTGSLSIKPEGVSHRDVFVDECTFLSLKIFDAAYFGLQLKEWTWLPPGAAMKHLMHIISSSDKRASLNAFGTFLGKAQELAPDLMIPPWLRRVHEIVSVHYRENFQIQELAREVKKHPFYVARSFEKYYGTDILTFKKNLRLHHAFCSALETGDKLTGLAYDYGFADQSHFCRDFKKLTALSPKQALKLLREEK